MVSPPRIIAIADRTFFSSEEGWLKAIKQTVLGLQARSWMALQIRSKISINQDTFRYLLGEYSQFDQIHWNLDQELSIAPKRVHLSEAKLNDSKPRFNFSASVHSLKGVISAYKLGADWVHVAPIFDPISKNTKGIGLNELKVFTNHSPLPVIAVGGVQFSNARHCFNAGAAGIASIGTVFESPHPLKEIDKLYDSFTAVSEQP